MHKRLVEMSMDLAMLQTLFKGHLFLKGHLVSTSLLILVLLIAAARHLFDLC